MKNESKKGKSNLNYHYKNNLNLQILWKGLQDPQGIQTPLWEALH